MNKKIEKKIRRKKRIRKTVIGLSEKPRLSVYRSNTHIYGQIIDDVKKVTIVSSSDFKIKTKGNKSDISKEVGKDLAALAVKKGVTKVVFDRSGNKYHGRVKALADGAREGGLIF